MQSQRSLIYSRPSWASAQCPLLLIAGRYPSCPVIHWQGATEPPPQVADGSAAEPSASLRRAFLFLARPFPSDGQATHPPHGPLTRAPERWWLHLKSRGANNWALQCGRRFFLPQLADGRMFAVTHCCLSRSPIPDPSLTHNWALDTWDKCSSTSLTPLLASPVLSSQLIDPCQETFYSFALSGPATRAPERFRMPLHSCKRLNIWAI
jgi:hypothetical protein